MKDIIHLFVLIPIVGFVFTLLAPRKQERLISVIAFLTVGLNLVISLFFAVYWLFKGAPSLNFVDYSLYAENDYNFFIDFYYDRVSATYLVVGNIIVFLVTIFSRYYMHKESGYKRFFNTVFFFYTGYVLTVLSGNFETLFIGWEILGVSSFLLIAFYRLRYLPVRNAVKVFSIYRIGDVGILLSMWMSHHLWHENVTFSKLNSFELVHDKLLIHSEIGIFISLMILIAALAKSAQLPFSAWLPRAMEGPTPSSAVFYGSLSVHIGAFLLMRTFPFWEHQISIRVLVIFLGLLTSAITTMIARVQSTVKGQIAYSSAAQIGIIFIEIALGLEVLALFHFAGNAFLRSYQLLVSPSVVSYLIKEQFYNYQPKIVKEDKSVKGRIYKAAYILSLKEWNLDTLIFRLIFKPLKGMGGFLGFLTITNVLVFFIPLYLIGFAVAYFNFPIPNAGKELLAILSALLALVMVVKAFNERSSSRLTWLLVVIAHFFIDLAITFNDHHLNLKEASIYLSGIVFSGLLGYYCIYKVRAFEHHGVGLNEHHGLVSKYRTYALLFFMSCLGIAGFPITTTFLGEDLILTHIHEHQFILATLVALTFIINGIAVVRIYARIFLGKITKTFQHSIHLTS